MCCRHMIVFFFQAEDGIRDSSVTGVQTCALPIYKAGYLLAVCAICAATLVTASMMMDGHAAMWAMLSVGFFNSIMFPTIFSLGVAELGPLTGNGSGLLNMAIVRAAVLPLIQ